jgi:predicted phage-related endonuclease
MARISQSLPLVIGRDNPWRKELRLDLVLPASVLGPVLRFALPRLASICRFDVIVSHTCCFLGKRCSTSPRHQGRKEQECCCRKDWQSFAIGALLSRRATFQALARAHLALARFGQCGDHRRVVQKESPVSAIQTGGGAEPRQFTKFNPADRRHFIGGSDARIIMGDDEAKLVRLWREKRGEIEPDDLSGNLIVQLGVVTEELNVAWYQRNSGETVKDVQRRVRHPVHGWMAATLDGIVEQTGAVFEAKFMLPWAFTEDAAAEKYMAQLQHNMWVVAARSAVLSIITGGGKWVEVKIHADPLFQHLLLTAEKKFWRCVMSGEQPRLFGVEPPRPRLEAVRIVDMSASNSWAELAATFRRTRPAFQEHEAAKADLKKLVPEDAREAAGHGLRAKRSKSGAVSFDLLDQEDIHAPL